MTALANDTDLKFASIDLSLYHINTGILLQFWSGFIVGFVSDGSPPLPCTRQRRVVPNHAVVPHAGHLPPVMEDIQRWRELSLRGARQRRRSDVVRLLLRFHQRLPGQRNDVLLRRPSR